jgi:hypothetical protein
MRVAPAQRKGDCIATKQVRRPKGKLSQLNHLCAGGLRIIYTSMLGLEGILHENVELSKPKDEGILDWVKDPYYNSCGFRVGTFSQLFSPINDYEKQPTEWTSFALDMSVALLP